MEGVTLLGDSQVNRLINTLRTNSVANISSSNFAVGGLCVSELKQEIRRRVQTFNSVCFILISINDILKLCPIKTIKNNIKISVDILINNNKTVLISTLPPILNPSKVISAAITEINIFILSLQTRDNVIVIEFHKQFVPFKPHNLVLYQRRYYNNRADNIHLSAKGHLLLHSLITAAVPLQ